MAKRILTKVCRSCGREFYWKTVERGKILDIDFRVDAMNKCPYCGSPLDYNFHRVADKGNAKKTVTFVKRCPVCGFEVKLLKMSGGKVVEFNKEAEKIVFCPVCRSKMVIEAHDFVI